MGKYIITGGGWNNKGAESMLYTVISDIRSREPNSDITVLLFGDSDKNVDKSLLDNIKIFKTDLETIYKLLDKSKFKLFKYKIKNKFPEDIKELYKEITSCDAVLDVSGFAISSKWGRWENEILVSLIKLANKFGKKIILLPQSFGPFDYTKAHGITKEDIRKWLKKADLIFCREKDGYNQLKEMGLKNIVFSYDMVLQNSKPYKGIFIKDIEAPNINIEEKSVLIFPSIRIFEREVFKFI